MANGALQIARRRSAYGLASMMLHDGAHELNVHASDGEEDAVMRQCDAQNLSRESTLENRV